MLDDAMILQLSEVFSRLEGDVKLVYCSSPHPKQQELLAMLDGVAGTSAKITREEATEISETPRFSLEYMGEPSGVVFSGIPGGHEFTSLVLAILNADGKGKLPDAALQDRIRRLSGPIRLRTFVSLSCENCPDVVQALNLMALLHDDFHHEMVDGEFAADEVQALKIQGVPSVVAGTKLIRSGKSSLVDLIGALEAEFGSEKSKTAPRDLGDYDVAVVGGGPAGAASAIYAARKGLKTVVITDRMGGQLQDTKAIENLISVPYTEGARLSANLSEHLEAYDIEVLEHRRVTSVKAGKPIELALDSGESLRTGSLIIATGAKWRELGIEGEKEYLGRGVAFCPHCDGPYYKGKDIVVVGGGNSGVEAALDLAGIVKSVTLVEYAPELKADAVLVERLRALPNSRVITNAQSQSIQGDADKATGLQYQDRATKKIHTLDIAGVFVQIGLVPNSEFVRDLVDTNRHGEIIVDDKGRTSQRGIYAAGDVTTVPYKQIVVAIGEGAKAGLAAFEDQLVA